MHHLAKKSNSGASKAPYPTSKFSELRMQALLTASRLTTSPLARMMLEQGCSGGQGDSEPVTSPPLKEPAKLTAGAVPLAVSWLLVLVAVAA